MKLGLAVGALVFAFLGWQYINHMPADTIRNNPLEQNFHPKDVAKKPPKKSKTIIIYAPPIEDLDYEKSSAFSYIDSVRDAMGMNQFISNDALEIAAQNHAAYLIANNEKSHFEKKGLAKFTGVAPINRAMYAKYDTLSVSENLSTGQKSGKESIDGLMAAIYHRFGFLSPSIDEMGVGASQDEGNSSNSAFVYLMGNSRLNDLCQEESFSGTGRYAYKVCRDEEQRIDIKSFRLAKTYNQKHNPEVIVYPYDGQNEVPPAFYNEDPDPLPDMEVSGFPISIEFNSYFHKSVSVYSFRLFEADSNREIEVRYMDKGSDPNNRFSDKQYAIFPLQRLDYNSRYRAELSYIKNEQEYDVVWGFETVRIEEKLYTIDKDDQEVEVEAGRDVVLYFKPKNSSDLLKNIHYPSSVFVKFIDNNTIVLSVPDGFDRNFTIDTGTRKVTVLVL